MFTVLRITGPYETLDEIARNVHSRVPHLRGEVNRQGALVIDLSRETDWDRHISEMRANLAPIVDQIDFRNELVAVVDSEVDAPNSKSWLRAYRFPTDLLRFLSEHHLALEVTVYPPMDDSH